MDTEVAPLSPAPSLPQQTQAQPSGSDSKKRRIAPTALGPASSTAGNIATAGAEGAAVLAPQQLTDLVSEHVQSSGPAVQAVAATDKTKKRRITPILVTNLPMAVTVEAPPAEAFANSAAGAGAAPSAPAPAPAAPATDAVDAAAAAAPEL